MGQLSSEEEQMFSQIVEGITKEDANFAKKITRRQPRPHTLFYGLLSLVLGITLLLVGLILQGWWISLIGFSAMTAGGYLASHKFSQAPARIQKNANSSLRVSPDIKRKQKFSQRLIQWSLGNSLRTQKEAWRYMRKVGLIAMGLVLLALFIPLAPLRLLSTLAIFYAFYVVLVTVWMVSSEDDNNDQNNKY